jgi:protein-S-isoprenylcysteine O-methyltransferase Ste14
MFDLIRACWIIFLGIWFAAAPWTKSTAERASWRQQLSYRLPLALTFALLLTSFGIPILQLRIVPSTPAIHILAGALCVIGLFVAVWARATLGANWSSDVTFKQDHELIMEGPYRFVRHPIYTGLTLMLLGSALASGRLGPIVGLAFGFLSIWVKLRLEEALMMRHFPSDYSGYKANSKALLPFIL